MGQESYLILPKHLSSRKLYGLCVRLYREPSEVKENISMPSAGFVFIQQAQPSLDIKVNKSSHFTGFVLSIKILSLTAGVRS